MQRDNSSRWLAILAVIIALLGLLFGDNLYERYTGHPIFAPAEKSLPEESKTTVNVVTATAQPTTVASPTRAMLTLAPPTAVVVTPAPLKIETQVTMGGVRKNYNLYLNDGEIIVGHADKFQGYSTCVAFLIVGPGSFEFWVESGLWDRWINTTPQSYQPLLQEQINTLINKYQCSTVKTVRLP